MGQLTLKITIPQIAMAEKAQGYINPELLDDGIPALFFNYFLSGSKTVMILTIPDQATPTTYSVQLLVG